MLNSFMTMATFSSWNSIKKAHHVDFNRLRGEDLKKSANQKQESPVAVMFVNGSGRNE